MNIRIPWPVLGLALLVAGVAAAAVLALGAPTSSTRTSTELVTAQDGVVQSTVTGTGNVEPATNVTVNFQASGVLQSIKVKLGQHVNKGQLLATLDPTAAQLTVNQAQQSLTAAQDQLTNAENQQSAASSSSSTTTTSTTTTAATTTAAAAAVAHTAFVAFTAAAGPSSGSGSGGSTGGSSGSGSGSGGSTGAGSRSGGSSGSGAGGSGGSTGSGASGSGGSSGSGAGGSGGSTGSGSRSGGSTGGSSGSGSRSGGSTGGSSGSGSRSGGSTGGSSGSGSRSGGSTGSGAGGSGGSSTSGSGTSAPSAQTLAANVASAQAAVDGAQASLRNAENALTQTRLFAPASGTVVSIASVSPGESVSSGGGSGSGSGSGSGGGAGSGAGSAASAASSASSSSSGLIEIASTRKLTMTVSFSESDIGKVHVGQPATITLNALSGVELPAHVSSISPLGSSSSGVVSYDATLTINSSNRSVKPGMSASASVIIAQASGVNLPSSAVPGSRGSIAHVEVMQSGHQVSTAVVVGLVGDSRTQIVSGLRAGQQVVVTQTLPSLGTSTASSGAGATLGGGGGFPGGGLGGAGGFFRRLRGAAPGG